MIDTGGFIVFQFIRLDVRVHTIDSTGRASGTPGKKQACSGARRAAPTGTTPPARTTAAMVQLLRAAALRSGHLHQATRGGLAAAAAARRLGGPLMSLPQPQQQVPPLLLPHAPGAAHHVTTAAGTDGDNEQQDQQQQQDHPQPPKPADQQSAFAEAAAAMGVWAQLHQHTPFPIRAWALCSASARLVDWDGSYPYNPTQQQQDGQQDEQKLKRQSGERGRGEDTAVVSGGQLPPGVTLRRLSEYEALLAPGRITPAAVNLLLSAELFSKDAGGQGGAGRGGPVVSVGRCEQRGVLL